MKGDETEVVVESFQLLYDLLFIYGISKPQYWGTVTTTSVPTHAGPQYGVIKDMLWKLRQLHVYAV